MSEKGYDPSVKLFDEGKVYESGRVAGKRDKEAGKSVSSYLFYPNRYSSSDEWREGYESGYCYKEGDGPEKVAPSDNVWMFGDELTQQEIRALGVNPDSIS